MERVGGISAGAWQVARSYAAAAGAGRRVPAGEGVGSAAGADGPRRLIAASVRGPIGFEPPAELPRPAIPFYASPADRNAVATAIRLGQRVDVLG